MNLSEIRNAVWRHLDLDFEDLPEELIDGFVRQGQREILNAEVEWPHLRKKWTLNVSTADTDLSTAAVDLRPSSIEAVIGAGGEYVWMAAPTLARRVAEGSLVVQPRTAGYFSVTGSTLTLWPAPTGATTVTVFGQRTATVPTNPSDIPDVPADAHDVLYEWVLAQVYLQQDDLEQHQLHMQLFAQGLKSVAENVAQERAGTVVLNVGRGDDTSDATFYRPRYPFE